MPLLGAFLADAYLGRYRSVIIACTLYVLVIIPCYGLVYFSKNFAKFFTFPVTLNL
jgi:dipeptide/tripeptide permease